MPNHSHVLSPAAAGAALAATLIILFVLCALVQAVVPNLQLTHMWLALFTAAPIGSAEAWIGGFLSSLVFGWIAGFVFAWVYNKKAAWFAHT